MLIRRRVQSPPEDATQTLLTDLLKAPPTEARLRSVTLRSIKDQRREVLAPYPLRTWFDRVLTVGERLLGIVVIAFFGWWLIDGYGRDWWYARQQQQVAQVAQKFRAAAQPAEQATPAQYPELGASLPVVDERLYRPSIEVDYLVPARTFVAPLAPSATPVPVAAPPIDLRPTYLQIPAINMESDVVEVFIRDGVWQVADYAVGYHNNTGVAGSGNMVLAGHKGLRGAVFRNLEQIAVGDEIVVTAAGQRYQYRVRTTGRVWPNQVEVMFPTEQAQMTLLTCTNWDTQRFVVVADLVGAVPTAAAGGN